MLDPVEVTQKSPRAPWNKGKLIGAKPPLRSKHVWSIRTRLQVDGRTAGIHPDRPEVFGLWLYRRRGLNPKQPFDITLHALRRRAVFCHSRLCPEMPVGPPRTYGGRWIFETVRCCAARSMASFSRGSRTKILMANQ